MEDDYSILPYPKWDEAQENYYTMVDGGHQIQAVPLTTKNLERAGTILEALNAESYQGLPEVLDELIKSGKIASAPRGNGFIYYSLHGKQPKQHIFGHKYADAVE